MYQKNKYLVIDTETGGLDSTRHSILSIAGVLWDPSVGVKPIFDLLIKEDNIIAEPQALKVNKVNLDVVRDMGLSPKEAVKEIRKSLNKHIGSDRRKVQIVAHNAPFDIGFTKRLYGLANEKYGDDFMNKSLDTCSILQFLIMVEKAQGFRATADVLFENANVTIPEELRHTAMGDALATAKSIHKICRSMRGDNYVRR